MSLMQAIPAPAGWGHRPGVNLVVETRPDLPDLPMLEILRKRHHPITPIIRQAIESIPGLLPQLKATDLVDKYGVGRSVAYDVLRSAECQHG